MRVTKEAGVLKSGVPGPEDLEAINALARRELKPEEVYTFSVVLCDNEVDRDFERFSPESLEKLAELFTGKTGIFDHAWSAAGQKARIYRCRVEETPGTTRAGDACRRLRAEAYLLRTEGNRELIEEIDGGIKKEVSVGCSVRETVCSICGNVHGSENCGHVKGRTYNGKLCYAELRDPTDAYEWSFVAVPAQRNAGVIKHFGEERTETDHQERLEKEAALGRKYLEGLRREVTRLSGIVQPELKSGVMEKLAERMDEEELLQFQAAFTERLRKLLPAQTQLGAASEARQTDDKRFMI